METSRSFKGPRTFVLLIDYVGCAYVCVRFGLTPLVYVSGDLCLLLIYMEPMAMPEEREREREHTRTHPRLRRDPRPVGRRRRVPRTHATLQLVSETGWQHPVRSISASLHQLLKMAWPLVQLDARPPMAGRTLAVRHLA